MCINGPILLVLELLGLFIKKNVKTLFACIKHKITIKQGNKKEETPGEKTTYGAL